MDMVDGHGVEHNILKCTKGTPRVPHCPDGGIQREDQLSEPG